MLIKKIFWLNNESSISNILYFPVQPKAENCPQAGREASERAQFSAGSKNFGGPTGRRADQQL